MYRCQNCGGNLVYDIPSHMLVCKYCNVQVDPYSIEKESDGFERDTYETMIFTCPQCGGEILSIDENSAAGFCSYCGASTILTSRISNEKRPIGIVPFEITKEQCKEMYYQRMRNAIFAPKALKDPRFIESFRGIYIPYWKYRIMQRDNLLLDATKTHREGDYIVTDHYKVNFDIDSGYDGYVYDASSSFYDNISENIAPFNLREEQKFTPSLLSGFYADTSDVPPNLYIDEATENAIDNTFENIKKDTAFQGLEFNTPENENVINNAFCNSCSAIEGTMLPVWFMSYRKKNRVMYSAINGQTGKLVTDIPIDNKKYILFSLLLAIPIYIILDLFFVFKPNYLLKIISIISFIVSVIFILEITAIRKKELNIDDRGLNWKNNNPISYHKKRKINIKNQYGNTIIIIMVLLFIVGPIAGIIFKALSGILVFLATLACSITGLIKFSKVRSIKGRFGFVSAIIATFVSCIVDLGSPVMDEYYYIGAVVSILAVLCTVTSIIKNYNVLSSSKLPQFNRQGGDDRA